MYLSTADYCQLTQRRQVLVWASLTVMFNRLAFVCGSFLLSEVSRPVKCHRYEHKYGEINTIHIRVFLY
jgi:hypothetical protein